MRHGLMALTMLAMVACGGSSAQNTASATAPKPEGPRVVLPDGTSVRVEVAATDETRSQGLMYRDHLAEDAGMIFLFKESGEYPFWMKNTLIPLDMIWIDDQRRIAHIEPNVPPCKADPCASYPPNAQAKYVLELGGGVAAKHHLKAGDTLRFEAMDNVEVR